MEYSGVDHLTVDISKLFRKSTKLIDNFDSVKKTADKKTQLIKKIHEIAFCVSLGAIIFAPGVAAGFAFVATTITFVAIPLLLGALFLSLGILVFKWILDHPYSSAGDEMVDNHEKKIEAKKAPLHEALQKSFGDGKAVSKEILDLIEKYGKQYEFLKEWFSPGVTYEEFIEGATAKLANPIFIDVIKNYRMELKKDLISVDRISKFAKEWKDCYSECNDKEQLAADFRINSDALYLTPTHWFQRIEGYPNFLIPESLYKRIWESSNIRVPRLLL